MFRGKGEILDLRRFPKHFVYRIPLDLFIYNKFHLTQLAIEIIKLFKDKFKLSVFKFRGLIALKYSLTQRIGSPVKIDSSYR